MASFSSLRNLSRDRCPLLAQSDIDDLLVNSNARGIVLAVDDCIVPVELRTLCGLQIRRGLQRLYEHETHYARLTEESAHWRALEQADIVTIANIIPISLHYGGESIMMRTSAPAITRGANYDTTKIIALREPSGCLGFRASYHPLNP